ncbi:TMEM175 family protein [Rhabdothermincola sp.]|uniref:TMEM175 family protein n=1 Tax=Rhabdothermincola sp. TaxID=2820405 RepID=UPI002FE309B5
MASGQRTAATSPRYERGSAEFGRVVSFADGVAAIALTLLILGIDLPRPTGDPASANVFELVGDLSEQIFAFLLSFVLIAFYWFGHHRFVGRLRAIDGAMIAWTMVFLLLIVIVPFEAQVIGFYAGNEQAITLYAAWFVVFGIVDIAGYQLARARRLLHEEPSREVVRFALTARGIAPVVFALSIPVAYLVSPDAAMWSWLAIWPLSALLTRNPPPGA